MVSVWADACVHVPAGFRYVITNTGQARHISVIDEESRSVFLGVDRR